jgi:cellulose synthase/poly-beta-1,6-N-acetylglucosamine synthase-like glycosyltransferase
MMSVLIVLFWLSIAIVSYTYMGYALVLFLTVHIKEALCGKRAWPPVSDYPEVALLVTAYNEKDVVAAKVKNSLELNYPKDRLRLVWITDGSDDGTPDLLRQYPDGTVTVFHREARAGKISAMNRGVQLIDSPIVVFSDANTMLGKESIRRIVALFANPKVGCVSGEKRIAVNEKDVAAGAGEGLYWKYESFLKRYDARLYSVVGAAGELFAIRREYFAEVEKDTLLDDFIISLRIAMQGHTTQYDPEAYACETASASVEEELKRKIRIAAGGFQSIARLLPLLNVFRYGVLSVQYISHRVLRWTLAPLSLAVLLIGNLLLVLLGGGCFFTTVLVMQVCFYAMALLGWFLQNRQIKLKVLFVPYYFFMMNYAVYLGFFRYLRKSQDVNWERAKRRN